jgi:MFS family permease
VTPPDEITIPLVRRRARLPAFITDLWSDPAAFRALIAACAAIAAVGLDPHIGDPGMPAIRAQIRADEGIRSLLMAGAVAQAGMLLLGGVIADRFRSERLMQAALGALALLSLAAIVVPADLPLVVVRVAAWFCVGLILPFAVGAIAIVYRGPARATALGVAFAVYGAATATAPALALANGPLGSPWPAFALCAVVATVAMVIGRQMPDLPGADPSHRPAMVAVALFSFGIVAIVGSVIQVGTGMDPVRLTVIVVGIVALIAAFVVARIGAEGLTTIGVDLRPVAVALAVGIVIGFAQAAPMLQLPAFFTAVQGSAPIVATIAIAPFVVALLVAGPVSGYLLQRIGPRTLIAGGAIAVGLANLILVAILEPRAGYPWFILPFALIGAGFVVATTVRTAIIYASVPKGLPASAAALNEASIGMGGRVGVVVAVMVTTEGTIQAYRAGLEGLPPGVAETMLTGLRTVLGDFGLRSTAELTAGLDQATVAAYAAAVVEGMRFAMVIPGVVAIVTGLIAFVAMGSRDPVRSVWELADERTPAVVDDPPPARSEAPAG